MLQFSIYVSKLKLIIHRYEKIKFFYDIPKEHQGGPAIIIKDEVPSPLEWLEEYQIYLENKKANKNKTALQVVLIK